MSKREPWFLSKMSTKVKAAVKKDAIASFTYPWTIIENILKKHYGIK